MRWKGSECLTGWTGPLLLQVLCSRLGLHRDDARAGNALGDEVVGEVEPALALIKYCTVAGDNDVARGSENGVWVGDELDVDGRADLMVGGDGCQQRFQPAAIGDGLIKVPDGTADAEHGQFRLDEFERRPRFGEHAVVAVHAGYVPVAALTARENDATGERRFQRDKEVKTIDNDDMAGQVSGVDLMGEAALALGIATSGSRHRLALPSRKGITVADELEGRLVVITSREEPGEVGDGRLKRRESIRREPFLVGRMGATMCLLVRHEIAKCSGARLWLR